MSFLSMPATTTSLGLVQVGTNISVDSNGVISTSSGGGGTVGTWVPTITGSGGSVALTISQSHYSKNGQMVLCTFDFLVSTISASGNLTLSGLPFTSISGSGYVGSVLFSAYFNLKTPLNFIGGSVLSSSTSASLWKDTGSSSTTVDNMSGGVLQSNSRLIGTVQYITAT
jgi:hypothetical protein